MEKILRSPTPKLEYVITAIEKFNRYVCYNKRELLGSLQAHEWKTKQNEMVREQALTKYAACYRRQSRHKSSSLLQFK